MNTFTAFVTTVCHLTNGADYSEHFWAKKNLEVQKMVTREDLVSAWRAMPLISGTRSNWVRSPNFFLSPNNLKAHKTNKKVAQLLAQARKVIIRDQHLFRSN